LSVIKGVRQRDLLSSYLFIWTLEITGAAIINDTRINRMKVSIA